MEESQLTHLKHKIVYHTQMCQRIRAKLKRMIRQLYLPDIGIERIILNYVGVPEFPFYTHLKPKYELDTK
jgi:hypothetical protein